MPWFVKLEEGVVDKARFDAAVPAHLAASMAEADALIRHDPLIQLGCVRWTLHQWQPVFTGTSALGMGKEPVIRNGTEAPDRSSADGIPAPPG